MNPTISYTIGGFPSQTKDGSLLLSPDVNTFLGAGALGPYSLLHLAAADNTAQQGSYRDWMKTGITFTGNADQGYIGQKAGELDFTDMVYHWSDNPTKYLKDRLRMIFTSGYDPTATSGASSREGLEGMRLFPVDNDHVNVGLGDFYAGNLAFPSTVVEPTERLDILNGKLRIRQLPTDAIAPTLTKFLVVDDTPGPDFGVVKWRNVPPGTGSGCEWDLDAYSRQVYTAPGPPVGGCTDASWRVLIGHPSTTGYYKLTISANETDCINCGVAGGTNVEVKSDAAGNVNGSHISVASTPAGATHQITGLKVTTQNAALYNYGLDVSATNNVANNGFTYGAWIKAENQVGGTTAQLYGLRCNATAIAGTVVSNAKGVWGSAVKGALNYGVYGDASGGYQNYSIYGVNFGSGANDWAGYFNGRTFSPGGVWTSSDESLKTEITVLTEASERIMQLNPKAYRFRTDEFPTIGLPVEQQYGFLASELETVFPEMVMETVQPAEYDSLGNEVNPAVTFKAVNLGGITPMLVAAFQEQQATIAQLQDQINHCCAAQGDAAPGRSLEQGSTQQENDLQEQRLLIIPNPVADLTTLEYYVPKAGKVSLQVSTSEGKRLATLREELAEAGAYTYSWNTTKLVAGTYFCTFMLDGAVVVKRAVKVK
ncbi:MAG: tail fiber domain-containing protein [Flavobacteriales bacterium]|nr:tail fiber domain-containing protein [Flavobacteriales bacterium]MBK6893631.1 tail fiber domain-containing protein [Flavobacteriales bacterium]MBK7248657.1 tail fiber domain-containing protein [Flavobacteriales bacterium]MBK9597951.1 tail fiber domain-containing protein [Flavobacteriales bacterium]QQS73908.1 MAG: tail fiber domain-containing protein [Flavobacteriales bacterium]